MALDEYMEEVHEAVKDLKLLEFDYTANDGEMTHRVVEPYEIKGDKFWGWDVSKNGIRQFFMEGIDDVEVTEQPFFPKFPIKIM